MASRSGKTEPLPLQPRGLSRVQAALYVGISTTLFDQLVADGRMPQPRRINSRKIWDRWAIDASFDDLPEEGATALERWQARKDERENDLGAFYLQTMGYDPTGMTDEEIAVAEARRIAIAVEQVKRAPLNRREQLGLRGLLALGEGWSRADSVKGVSIGTQERLEARGFVEIKKEANTWGQWRLTPEGRAKANDLGDL